MIAGAVAALAAPYDWLYLEPGIRRTAAAPGSPLPVNQMVAMVPPLTTPQQLSIAPASGRAARAIVLGGAGVGVVALLAAMALWFHYGTAVFFETIVSGISACF